MSTMETQRLERAAAPAAAGAHVPASRQSDRARPASISGALVSAGRAFAAALALEEARGTPFLLVPVLFCAGAALYFALPFEPGWPLLAAALVGPAAARFLVARHRVAARLCAAFAFAAAGAGAGKIETVRADTAMLGSAVSTVLTGRVVRVEHQASGRTRYTIDVETTRRPLLRYAPDRVRVTARADPGIAAGERIEGVVRLFPPSGPVRPYGYDFAFESYMAGIGATGFFLGMPDRQMSAGARDIAPRLAAGLANMRQAIAGRIRRHVAGAEGEIAAALIAGTRAGIPEEVDEALRRAGLAHILSISGLHMALVAGTVMLALRALFALAPGFSSRRPVKKYAAALALAAAAYYLAISGAAVAAQRSFIMIAVMLVALLFDRAAITMRNLAIAALIIAALAPHEVVGPSFQMSFAATAALIAAYTAWSNRVSARTGAGRAPPRGGLNAAGRRLAYFATGIAATSLIAGGATTVYAIWHFHRVAPLGLVANLAAMPVVSTLIMPPAVAAGVLMPVGLEGPPLTVMGQGIAIMVAVARWVADHSPIDAVGAMPPLALILFTAALLVATIATSGLRWLALPLALAATLAFGMRTPPDLLVSEDARLAALMRDDGLFAVNRPRPNGFTIGIWQKALAATGYVKPRDRADGKPEAETRFVCDAAACEAVHAGGAVVVHAKTRAAAAPFCGVASVIVIADATAANPCRAKDILVVTARDLARRGSLEVRFKQVGTESAGASGGPLRAEARFALPRNERPWFAHRKFSREARGLAPYKRGEKSRNNKNGKSGKGDKS
ncbi:ComEC/Rec2 family competence protein [Nitratireductor alexandrii]|uniref:ComEC/Rec2 family competence protein n=1 Tax=Nitratireductor alexandrii TaxID=2448161 RepID=UPI000FD8495E|nr:ComEC/Rec2 family competence protein [Nitratireductor alexandrii]